MLSILILDDNPRVDEIFGMPLREDFGHDVRQVLTVKDAWSELATNPPDVLLLDRQMPEWDADGEADVQTGDRFLAEVTVRHPRVCVIMLTNNADVRSVQWATRYGAFRYFSKDVPMEELDAACRHGVQTRRIQLAGQRLLRLDSGQEVLASACQIVRDAFGDDVRLGYLEVCPGKSFRLVEPVECDADSSRASRFVDDFPDGLSLLEGQRFCISAAGNAPKSSILLPEAKSRLVVSVFRESDEDPVGVLCAECLREEAFEREHADELIILADYVGAALLRSSRCERRSDDTRKRAERRMLADVGERICNPLQVAQSHLELLMSRLREGSTSSQTELSQEDVTKRIDDSLRKIENAIQMTVNLRFDYSHVALEPTEVDLSALTRARLDFFRADANEIGCHLIDDISDKTPKLRLPPAEMRCIVDCLIENALDAIRERRKRNPASETRGEVVVTVSCDPTGKKDVLLSVVDDGCGIELAHLPMLFDRFFTTKPETFQSGKESIGLYRARQIVEAFDGRIEAANTSKGGAEFVILFPVDAKRLKRNA